MVLSSRRSSGTETSSAARRVLRWLLFFGVAVLFIDWAMPPVRSFPPSRPFSGAQWYDPYAAAGSERLRASFHVHSRSWGGLTSGSRQSEDVRGFYRSLGYDVFAISNYQRIDEPGPDDGIPIPVYEHGFGLGGQHQLVIGARRVAWTDFLLPQGARHKQFVLDRLRADDPIVVLNHPDRFGSYSLEDLERLVGYTGIEIRSRHTSSRAHWDAALSAGRPIWGFCTDDRHRIREVSDVGYGWLVVHAADRAPGSVLRALRAGAFHSIWSPKKPDANALVFAGVTDSRLRVEVARPAAEIRFIGQGGRRLQTVMGRTAAEYELAPGDSYVRVEVAMKRWTLYLNPVFRHDGDALTHPEAPVVATATAVSRGGGLLVALIGLAILWRRRSG